MGKIKDLEGVRFGTWTATNEIQKTSGRALRKCICDCGNESFVLTSNLTRGLSNGCDNCRKQKQFKQDGDSIQGAELYGLYTSHSSMMARCYYEKDKSYCHYGAIGVNVCEEWHDYKIFKTWSLKSGWFKGAVIGRNRDTGNYTHDNVSWITRSENSKESGKHSRRATRKLTEDQVRYIRALDVKPGVHNTIDLHKVADEFGISYHHVQGIRNNATYKDVI